MQYQTTVTWERGSQSFTPKEFDRTFTVSYNGGTSIQGSAAPEFLGKAELPNPEEMFIGSIASCFMLTFLYWAATKGIGIDQYTIKGIGTLSKNAEGKLAVTTVELHPEFKFTSDAPSTDILNDLYKKAHEQCLISSSVKTEVIVKSESKTTA